MVSKVDGYTAYWCSEDGDLTIGGIDERDMTQDELNSKTQAVTVYTQKQVNELLHPRVKMTQAEFDEYTELNFNFHLYATLKAIFDESERFSNLWNRLQGNTSAQVEFANLWSYRKKSIKMIDIVSVPTMKWFVRSKKSDKDGYYWWLTYNGSNFAPEYMPKKNASSLIKSFDTKEQAGLWTNPLTEAVQLPVED